jgi:AcrR family transcriptional regulator
MARSGRKQRSSETRAKIIAAAGRLFVDKGYVDTTMSDLAADAGVAVQTLYLTFGSKAAILKSLHDTAVVGDDEPVALLQRAWVRAFRREPSVRAALELWVTNHQSMNDRVAAVYGVLQQAAADAEVSALYDDIRGQRLRSERAFAKAFATKRGFPPELSAQRTADMLYALGSPETFRLLVVERGWSPQQVSEWLLEVLTPLLTTG